MKLYLLHNNQKEYSDLSVCCRQRTMRLKMDDFLVSVCCMLCGNRIFSVMIKDCRTRHFSLNRTLLEIMSDICTLCGKVIRTMCVVLISEVDTCLQRSPYETQAHTSCHEI